MHAPLVLAALLAALPACPQPLLTAYRADTAPALDGALVDPCWQAANVASPFISAQGAGVPEEQTQVRVCWDEANLYVGVEASERLLDPRLNMLQVVKAELTGRDAAVWTEDSVEVFLQPPGPNYYHFAANSGTGTYEAAGMDAAWGCDWRCVAKRTEKSYVLEMAIPFAALGGRPSGAWHANFARTRTYSNELSTWCGLQGGFHQPEAFGTLQFAPTGPALGPATLDLKEEGLTLSAAVGGAADNATSVSLQVAAGEESTSAKATGPGPRQLTAPLPKAALVSGQTTVTYALAQGDQVFVRSAEIPEPIAAGLVALRLEAYHADAVLALNGEAVALAEGAADLKLKAGLNVLTIDAKATGDAPGINPHLTHGGRALLPKWMARADTPPEAWRTQAPEQGWTPAVARPDAMWADGQAREAHFATALYVGDRGPQLFPKMDTFYLPRGSQQLLRCYVHAPQEVPSTGYRMVVEAPASLHYIATDPLGGGAAPEVTEAGGSEVGGVGIKRYHVAYDMLPGQGFELSMRWGDATGHTLSYQPTITAGGTLNWRHLSMTLKPPPGAVSAHPLIIKWQDRGITGTFWVDNLAFHEQGSTKNLLEMGTFDETEWGAPWFIKPEGTNGSKCVKIVSTPEVADRQQAVWVDKEAVVPVEAGKEYVIELDVKCEALGSAHARALCGLLFEAPADLAEGELPLSTYFETLDGVVSELPTQSRVRVLPPLKNVRPRRARLCPCYYSSRFSSPEVARAYADNCWASGITWTYGGIANDVVPLLADRGHSVFLSIGWEPWSATSDTQELLKQHPELQAVDFKGQRISHTFCPTWVLSEGTEVTDSLEKWLLGTLNTTPYQGANWDLEEPVVDPPTYCVCERCLQAFRAYAKLAPEAELSADTVLSKYRAEWTAFRCTQNAEMAGRLKAIVRKANRPVEFSMYSGYQSTYTKEHYGVDWSLLAPHLDLAIAGYNGEREAIRGTVDALGGVPFMGGEMWYLSDRQDDRPMPRMETWRNRILRQFAESGGNGCLIWWLPPMDGGAFYATSEAAEIIAKYEDFFTLKQRCDDKVQVTGLEPRNWMAFEKDGEVLVLLLNFGPGPVSASVRVGEKEEKAEIEGYGVRVIVLK